MKDEKLIALFETMLAEHWAYEWGAARRGCVDCSGAFVYAYKELGGGTIEHGSNTIGRKRVRKLLPISEAKPGYAAFKRRDDGGEPEKYRGDGIGNLYHIGLVARDGRNVLNAKSTNYGFCSDPLSEWDYVAPLNAVSYTAPGEDKEDESMATLYKALVATKEDDLRVRDAPKTGRIIGHAPRSKTVDVLSEGDWPRIRYGELVGYASAAYLKRIDDAMPVQPVVEPDAPDMDVGSRTFTTLICEDSGSIVTLLGKWRMASD